MSQYLAAAPSGDPISSNHGSGAWARPPDADAPSPCRWCKKPGSFFQAPLVRQCAGCLSSNTYHISCTVEGCFTVNCEREGHSACWAEHRNVYPPHLRAEHSEIDPVYKLFVDAVLSEKDPSRFASSQSRERFARWFSVSRTANPSSPTCEDAHLWLYDRFTRLCDPNRTGNRESQHHFPTFVSFIGSTSAGKSTILRAVLLLGLLDSVSWADTGAVVDLVNQARGGRKQMPVPRSANVNDITTPTTFGVHLYRDEGLSIPQELPHRRTSGFGPGPAAGAPVSRKYPLLLADCEGFDASVARPSASMLPGLGEDDDADVRKLPITAECYGRRGQSGVDLFYARVLYAISDVVVYVSKDDNVMHSLQKILEWASSAVDKSYNQPTRKTLIIVRNMDRAVSQPGSGIGDDEFERLYLHTHREVLWKNSDVLRQFVDKHNALVKPEDRIEDNQKLYNVLFHRIRCCYIPDRGDEAAIPPERAELLYKHFQALRARIESAAREEQVLRARCFAEHNVPTLTHILSEVFDHFRQSEDPLNFFLAARGDNPTPRNMSEHIANFLRMAFGQDPQATEDVDAAVVSTVALAFLVCVRRGFPNVLNPGDMFDLELKRFWAEAVDMYLQRYDRCLYRWFPRRGVEQVACTIRGRSQHAMHKGAAAGQVQPGEFSGKSWSEPEREGWVRSIRDRFVAMCHRVFPVQHSLDSPDDLLLALRQSTHAEARATLCRMRSNKTCFACLQAVPDHVLPCGHALCPGCVQEFAKPSRFVECAFDLASCTICGKHNIHQVQMKPKCAGVRILTLDGGGVRGIVELALLLRIQRAVGLDIGIKEMFDLIVGTSTGGIIALGLVMKNESLESMTSFFEEAAKATFSNPNGGSKLIAKAGMLVGRYHSIYPETNLKRKLEAFFGNTPLFAPATSGYFQSKTRVAVTTAKDGPDGGSTQSLIANYNRPRGDWTYFEREDDAGMDMAIWEAGLATSAAPIFLPVFRKGTTKYVDGALYANCPAGLALEEKDRIWLHDGASLDVLVSLGTGRQEREWKLPRVLRYSFFRPLLQAFERQMNSAVNWDSIESASSDLARGRLYRLNPRIESRMRNYVDLDDHAEMAYLRSSIEGAAGRTGEAALLQPEEAAVVRRIANTLLANLLFFEPDDRQSSPTALQGSIRCRLPHETQPTKVLLTEKIASFCYTTTTRQEAARVADIPAARWALLHDRHGRTSPGDMVVEEGQVKKFRLYCTLGTEQDPGRPYCVVAVRLKGVGEPFPISGFPATLQELRERWVRELV